MSKKKATNYTYYTCKCGCSYARGMYSDYEIDCDCGEVVVVKKHVAEPETKKDSNVRLIVYVVLDLHIESSEIVRIFAESGLAHKWVKENASKHECLDIEAHEVLNRA